jgi:hypothetical protein
MEFFCPIPAQFQPNFMGFQVYKSRLDAGFRISVYIMPGIKKGPMAFKPRSFILFLLIIVYLTEACDIKCCFSDIQ